MTGTGDGDRTDPEGKTQEKQTKGDSSKFSVYKLSLNSIYCDYITDECLVFLRRLKLFVLFYLSDVDTDALLSQVPLPSLDVILRYPIEVWASSGKPFVSPDGKTSFTKLNMTILESYYYLLTAG